MGLLSNLLQSQEQKDAEEERRLIRFESSIGRDLFGKIPAGHDREFFCLDAGTWVWHESWKDSSGKELKLSAHYKVKPSGIVKSLNGGPFKPITEKEKVHLLSAIKSYISKVSESYNKMIQE